MYKTRFLAAIALGLLLLVFPADPATEFVSPSSTQAADLQLQVNVTPAKDRSIDVHPWTGNVGSIQPGADVKGGATFCDGQWQGAPAWYLGSWYVGDEFYAVYQDMDNLGTCVPGPTYPFEVTDIIWVVYELAGGTTYEFQPLVFDDTAGMPCPMPGEVLCAGPLYSVELASVGGWTLGLPFEAQCCVNGPYFAGVYSPTFVGPDTFAVVTDDSLVVTARPCHSYNEWGEGWADLIVGYQFPGNLMLWSEGMAADQNTCPVEPLSMFCGTYYYPLRCEDSARLEVGVQGGTPPYTYFVDEGPGQIDGDGVWTWLAPPCDFPVDSAYVRILVADAGDQVDSCSYMVVIQPDTSATCSCPYQCDYDADGFLTALDLGSLIDVLFGGAEEIQDPYCPASRGDFDFNGFPDALDLSGLIDHLFAGGDGPIDVCKQIPVCNNCRVVNHEYLECMHRGLADACQKKACIRNILNTADCDYPGGKGPNECLSEPDGQAKIIQEGRAHENCTGNGGWHTWWLSAIFWGKESDDCHLQRPYRVRCDPVAACNGKPIEDDSRRGRRFQCDPK